MDSSWPEPLRTIHETVIGELLKGKKSATQLRTLLQKPFGDRGSVSAEELTEQISRSFSETLSILSSSCGLNEICQIVPTDGTVRVCSRDRSSKTSDHSRKRPAVKDRRGCYRRRNVTQSWITVSPTTEDRYAWRKYGQKEILDTKFPRCYFRCTHKHDQGCKATKQVQRIKEDSLLYQITYFGHHTCQDTLMRAPHIISGVADPMESYLLSFEAPPSKQNPRFACGITPSSYQELKDETQSDASDNKSCLDSAMWQDPMTAESSGPAKMKSYKIESFREEVVSSFHSSASTPLPGLDMETFSNKFPELDPDLCFDDIEFFQVDLQ